MICGASFHLNLGWGRFCHRLVHPRASRGDFERSVVFLSWGLIILAGYPDFLSSSFFNNMANIMSYLTAELINQRINMEVPRITGPLVSVEVYHIVQFNWRKKHVVMPLVQLLYFNKIFRSHLF